jgi:hypothetical protein
MKSNVSQSDYDDSFLSFPQRSCCDGKRQNKKKIEYVSIPFDAAQKKNIESERERAFFFAFVCCFTGYQCLHQHFRSRKNKFNLLIPKY